jgi:hypothetical protein
MLDHQEHVNGTDRRRVIGEVNPGTGAASIAKQLAVSLLSEEQFLSQEKRQDIHFSGYFWGYFSLHQKWPEFVKLCAPVGWSPTPPYDA